MTKLPVIKTKSKESQNLSRQEEITTTTNTMMITKQQHKQKFQQQAVLFQRKAAAFLAFSTTMFFLCIEHVKAFTVSPLSARAVFNENTILFFASGAHSLAKRWRGSSSSAMKTLSVRPPVVAKPASTESEYSNGANNNVDIAASTHTVVGQMPPRNKQRTVLRMAFGVAPPPTTEFLDMKTSINAFGGWYNKMDPVARPPVYDDELTDYTFTNPADSWPSTFENEGPYRKESYTTTTRAFAQKSRPRPFRVIRRIAGWFLGTPPVRQGKALLARQQLL